MEIEFANEQLALIETPEAAETELPVMVIQSARQRLNVIRAAPDVQTLQSWKSLGFEESKNPANFSAVSIMAQWKMMVRLEEQNGCMRVVIISLQEQLQGAA